MGTEIHTSDTHGVEGVARIGIVDAACCDWIAVDLVETVVPDKLPIAKAQTFTVIKLHGNHGTWKFS